VAFVGRLALVSLERHTPFYFMQNQCVCSSSARPHNRLRCLSLLSFLKMVPQPLFTQVESTFCNGWPWPTGRTLCRASSDTRVQKYESSALGNSQTGFVPGLSGCPLKSANPWPGEEDGSPREPFLSSCFPPLSVYSPPSIRRIPPMPVLCSLQAKAGVTERFWQLGQPNPHILSLLFL
jgi:hypothetical protein